VRTRQRFRLLNGSQGGLLDYSQSKDRRCLCNAGKREQNGF
jgi:hypothetical protein